MSVEEIHVEIKNAREQSGFFKPDENGISLKQFAVLLDRLNKKYKN